MNFYKFANEVVDYATLKKKPEYLIKLPTCF